jgi:hypothetical protein
MGFVLYSSLDLDDLFQRSPFSFPTFYYNLTGLGTDCGQKDVRRCEYIILD